MIFSGINVLASFVVVAYATALGVLMVYGLHRYWILFLYWRYHKRRVSSSASLVDLPIPTPTVTVQLPLYNEMYVADRLIETVCALDHPKDKLEIQVLDDSTDETIGLVEKKVNEMKSLGFQIEHIRRPTREGFKAGALKWGLRLAQGEFVAIFDADFMPPAGFIKATLPYFSDEKVGMVQTRWGHINADYSLLTRLQALFLDGHFLLEHTARHKSGAFFNFNGTAGIWRKKTIESAGGWLDRTLTEDLDLSYRAQLEGWKFVYVPEFVCPAELPVDIYAYQNQQRRWAKGAIQVARYILKDLWTRPIPLHTKVEATVHLTANIGYLLTFVVSLLLLPSLLLRQFVSWPIVPILEFGAFFMTLASIVTFYVVCQRELYSDWRWRIKDIPALLSFGIGMCISNAGAVWEGLTGKASDFIRTPKYNIREQRDNWIRKIYAKTCGSFSFLQLFFVFYFVATFSIAAIMSNWGALPFISLFLFGFSYVALLSYLHCTSE